jgi:hypothetical protein
MHVNRCKIDTTRMKALPVTVRTGWLLIASGIPLRPGDAALRAALVLAGGLWQATLVVVSWVVAWPGQIASSSARPTSTPTPLTPPPTSCGEKE